MSRIGNKPITVPAGVEVKMDGQNLTVKGPKGTLVKEIHKNMKVNSIKTEDYPTKAKRPKNSCLSKECLDREGFKRLPSWQSAVERYKKEMEEL